MRALSVLCRSLDPHIIAYKTIQISKKESLAIEIVWSTSKPTPLSPGKPLFISKMQFLIFYAALVLDFREWISWILWQFCNEVNDRTSDGDMKYCRAHALSISIAEKSNLNQRNCESTWCFLLNFILLQ